VVLVAVGRVLREGKVGLGAVNVAVAQALLHLVHGDDLAGLVDRQRPQRDGVERVKMAEFTPMPKARASTETSTKPGDLRNMRRL
jgi:hypothetical protein